MTHPGEELYELIKERGMLQSEFAAYSGMHPSHLNQIIKGRRIISARTATALERIKFGKAKDWIRRQRAYNLAQRSRPRTDAEQLMEYVQRLQQVPMPADLSPEAQSTAKALQGFVNIVVQDSIDLINDLKTTEVKR